MQNNTVNEQNPDIEQKKLTLEKCRTWIESTKWIIGGLILIIGFIIIKPQEQKRLDQQLKLQAITVYLGSLNTQKIDVWQRTLDGIRLCFKESDSEFIAYIDNEQSRIKGLKNKIETIDDDSLAQHIADQKVSKSPEENKQYQAISQQAAESIRITKQDLQERGITVQEDRDFPYVFAIAGSFPTLEMAKKFAKDWPKDMPYSPEVYKLRENLYVVQLGTDLTLKSAEEGVRYLKQKGLSPDAFVFRSRTPRQSGKL
jgi:hypothetical protein